MALPQPSPHDRAVLVADDDEAVRLLLEATLAGVGYRVVKGADGDEAWQLARQERPRVAVLDVTMPGASGVEVCRRIKSEPSLSGTAVVVVTARADEATRAAATAAGADAYVVKPFSPAALLRLVDSMAAR